MVHWWESLSFVEQIFATMAIAATVLLVLQFFLSLFSLGGGAVDVDTGGDFEISMGEMDGGEPGGTDSTANFDSGIKLFTLQGIVSFFSVFGWSALAMIGAGRSYLFTLTLSFLFGLLAMLALAGAFRLMSRLRADGTLDIRYAIGKSATVYLLIPARRAHAGKVSIFLQERIVELEALTDQTEPIPTGVQVIVVGIANQTTLLVERT